MFSGQDLHVNNWMRNEENAREKERKQTANYFKKSYLRLILVYLNETFFTKKMMFYFDLFTYKMLGVVFLK